MLQICMTSVPDMQTMQSHKQGKVLAVPYIVSKLQDNILWSRKILNKKKHSLICYSFRPCRGIYYAKILLSWEEGSEGATENN